MYIYAGKNSSALKKQITRIYIDYYQSLDFYVNGNLVPYQSFPLYNGKPLVPVTGTAIIDPVFGWNRFDDDGTPIISITQSSPFDLQILGIAYQVDLAVI
jgi:hypothetical protein